MIEARRGGQAVSHFSSVPVLFVLVVATSLAFSNLLSADELPTYRDLLYFTWPLKHFLRDRWMRGELPLWNPLLLMGTPFLANWQSGVFYPPSVLLLLPLPLGFNLFHLAHYFIALFGSWLWLRNHDLTVVPAAIGVAVFTVGGYLVSLLNLTNHLQAAVWAPWVLWGWERFCSRRRPVDLLASIAALSMQLLAASPENLLLTLVVACAWTIDRYHTDYRQLAGLFGRLALVGVISGGVCAAQMLPTIEYIGQSPRSGALAFVNVAAYSLQPVSILQLLLPHAPALLPPDAANSLGPAFENTLSLIQSYYLGVAPLCLTIVAVAFGRQRLLWGLLIAVGLILALGDHTPVFPALFRALPQLFGKFRYPEKFYFLVHVGASAAAAEGARQILDRHAASVRLALTILLTLAAIGIAVVVLRWLWPADYLMSIAAMRGRYLRPIAFVPLALDTYWKVQRLLLILAALGAILALSGSHLRPPVVGYLLLALTVSDLVSANRNLNPGMSWSELASRPPLIDPSEALASGRRIYHAQVISAVPPGGSKPEPRFTFWVPMLMPREELNVQNKLQWDIMNSDAGMIYGLANTSGGDGMGRESDEALLRVMQEIPLDRSLKVLRILGTGYMFGPDSLALPGLTEITARRDTPYHSFRVHDASPLVFAVSRLRAAPSPYDALRTMSRDDFDPVHEAVVEVLPPGWSDSGQDAETPRVTTLERRDELWRIRVETSSRSLVIINESFFPGWKASVDGSPAEIIRANAIVRGVVVDPGSHVVELVYAPMSFRLGVAISLASLLGITAWAATALRQSRSQGLGSAAS